MITEQLLGRIAELEAENDELRAALLEAMEWNWMDIGVPEEVVNRLEKLAPGDVLPTGVGHE
jgi:hypothetical protein